MIFYAGYGSTAALSLAWPRWPASELPTGFPLFYSLGRVADRRTRFPARQPLWALDNGAFAAIASDAGVPDPAATVATWRHVLELGARPAWLVAPDCPAHPAALAAGGYTPADAVARTVDGYLLAADAGLPVPVVPVITGDTAATFAACLDAYRAAGVLEPGRLVAVGALVGRPRQLVADVLRLTTAAGVRVHVLGAKGEVLAELRERWTEQVWSADSAAWSYRARRGGIRLAPDCPHPGDCRNCLAWAIAWSREQARPHPTQLRLGVDA